MPMLVANSRKPFRRGPWPRKQGVFPRGWPFGFLMPGYGLATSAWLPGPKDRRALGEQRVPYWLVVNYTLNALASGDDQFLPTGNFCALAFMASSTLGPGSFQTQNFQLADTQGQGFRFSRTGIIDLNCIGTAQAPFVLRRPYPMPDLLSLLNRISNRNTAANTVQIALYGLREYVQ